MQEGEGLLILEDHQIIFQIIQEIGDLQTLINGKGDQVILLTMQEGEGLQKLEDCIVILQTVVEQRYPHKEGVVNLQSIEEEGSLLNHMDLQRIVLLGMIFP